MADSDPVLVSRVLEILSDPALQEIHFTCNGLTVTGMRYSCLKQYIADGSLSLVVGPVSDAEEAHFNATHALPFAGTITFQYPWYGQVGMGGEQSVVIHECTHALNQIFDPVIDINSTEVAAYLAQAIYARKACSLPAGNVYSAAYDLADYVIGNNTDGSTFLVDPVAAGALSVAINNVNDGPRLNP